MAIWDTLGLFELALLLFLIATIELSFVSFSLSIVRLLDNWRAILNDQLAGTKERTVVSIRSCPRVKVQLRPQVYLINKKSNM